MNYSAIIQAIDSFKQFNILVLGDVILDAYFSGKVNRISPEAPVPILDIQSKEFRLGGAGNVALNLKALGATPILCSIVGNDENGAVLRDLLDERGIKSDAVLIDSTRKTSIKTRLMSGHHQLMRMDEEVTHNLSAEMEANVLKRALELIDTHQPAVIVFQDYDKGFLSEFVIKAVVKRAKVLGIKTAVDPKKRNFFSYDGTTLFKPNLRELKEGLDLPNEHLSVSNLPTAFTKLISSINVDMAFFTLSSEGVFITNGSQSHHIPAQKRNISDVSGAGDTVISVAACALAANFSMQDLAYVSNLAGGWVCQFPGVVPIDADSLKSEVTLLSR